MKVFEVVRYERTSFRPGRGHLVPSSRSTTLYARREDALAAVEQEQNPFSHVVVEEREVIG
jgi:hypothetical protein